LEEWPQSDRELQQLREYVMNYPAYQNVLISEDGRFTAIYMVPDVRGLAVSDADFLSEDPATADTAEKESSFFGKLLSVLVIQDKAEHEKIVTEKLTLTNEQRDELAAKVREIADRYDSDDFSIFITGRPVILSDHLAQVMRNMPRSILGTAVGILVLMFLIFRRVTPVLITLLIVVLSVVTVFGVSSIFNVPIRTSTQVFPPIVLAAGICDAIHLFTIFFQRLKKDLSKKDALAYAMKHSGLAMLFTSLTTMGGFLAFGFSDLMGIVELGISAAIGVGMALIFTYLLVPALLAVLPMSTAEKRGTLSTVTDGFWRNNVKRLSLFSARRPALILSITAVVAVIAIIGAVRIPMSFNVLTWFPEDEQVRLDTYRADAAFSGGDVLEAGAAIIDTNSPLDIEALIGKFAFGDIGKSEE
jgi:predicted RND superfamily exporter protein